ncbi:hypothetical protein WME77_27655 [Sorangium sp. So ce764]|uniref:hypothetical protein n=1 Tax=Sorangium sp. So ce764 TaxID=3133320 RepID=UPI003F5FC7CA
MLQPDLVAVHIADHPQQRPRRPALRREHPHLPRPELHHPVLPRSLSMQLQRKRDRVERIGPDLRPALCNKDLV